jgi:hypothetical protein
MAHNLSRKDFLKSLGLASGVALVGTACSSRSMASSSSEQSLAADVALRITPPKSKLWVNGTAKATVVTYHFWASYEKMRREGKSWSDFSGEMTDYIAHIMARLAALKAHTGQTDPAFEAFLAKPRAEQTFARFTNYIRHDAPSNTRDYLEKNWGKKIGDVSDEQAYENEMDAINRVLLRNPNPSNRRWAQQMAAYASLDLYPRLYQDMHEAWRKYVASSTIFQQHEKDTANRFLDGAVYQDGDAWPSSALTAYSVTHPNRRSGDSAIFDGGKTDFDRALQTTWARLRYDPAFKV